MSDLIDTTQMYLRTIYELIEEGVPPMRARIAERLHQAGPTVSQTVARMERDGLLTVTEHRLIELSPDGYEQARKVMRKHRISERFLVDILKIEGPDVHDEACKLEHVISEKVEKRLMELMDNPTDSPFGNPIPALDELGLPVDVPEFLDGVDALGDVVSSIPRAFIVRRISEAAQANPELLGLLADAGVVTGAKIQAWVVGKDGLDLRGPAGEECRVSRDVSGLLFVSGA
ncbi:metal-dependent transcriptional regulator [Propionicicella superfundia]|uniref:metal-dependent transcriptional regulator n=1 Tax=Propionicicella superfundia TaxID=348582 RepID=UPI0004200DE9|nr:metal-dependent transcriptional regulator [Propionicicella superfundia]